MAFAATFGGDAASLAGRSSGIASRSRRCPQVVCTAAGDTRRTRGLSFAAAAALTLLPIPNVRFGRAQAAAVPPPPPAAASKLAYAPPQVAPTVEEVFGDLPKGRLNKQDKDALREAVKRLPEPKRDPILHMMRQLVNKKTLRSPKTAQLSEADQLMLELDWEDEDDAFLGRVQYGVAALVTVGGIKMVHRGGVLWEQWMKDQAKRDEEEEIELTGQFIDPRADRIDEDEGKDGKDGKKTDGDGKDGKGPEGPDDGGSPDGDSSPERTAGSDALDTLLGEE